MVESQAASALREALALRGGPAQLGALGGCCEPPKWGPGAKPLEADAFLGLLEAKLHQILP